MYAEASTVLRAVVEDFFFNCWYLEIPSDNRIRHIPRCVHYHAQGFRSETFHEGKWENKCMAPPFLASALDGDNQVHTLAALLPAPETV
jgi:hypothetical protein